MGPGNVCSMLAGMNAARNREMTERIYLWLDDRRDPAFLGFIGWTWVKTAQPSNLAPGDRQRRPRVSGP